VLKIERKYKYLKLVDCGNIKKIIKYSDKNGKQNIQKLDSENYCVLSTGEVKKYTKKEKRENDLKSIRQTVTKLRDIINANITDTKKAKFLTLTYKENMTDTKRLYNDFKKFNMRLRFLGYEYEYIAVAEPQKRGAWHLHCILIFKSLAPYIPSKMLSKTWKNGFIKTNKIDSCDNVGAYLSAYLINIKDGQKTEKGKRLYLYPSGFNIYRISKGIKKPSVKWYFTDSEKQLHLTDYSKTYDKETEIILENGKKLYLNYMQYNKIKI
jgi:hypothetical protein